MALPTFDANRTTLLQEVEELLQRFMPLAAQFAQEVPIQGAQVAWQLQVPNMPLPFFMTKITFSMVAILLVGSSFTAIISAKKPF